MSRPSRPCRLIGPHVVVSLKSGGEYQQVDVVFAAVCGSDAPGDDLLDLSGDDVGVV